MAGIILLGVGLATCLAANFTLEDCRKYYAIGGSISTCIAGALLIITNFL